MRESADFGFRTGWNFVIFDTLPVMCFQLFEVTSDDLQFLYEMGQQCSCPDVRVNAIRIVATFGTHFAKNKEPHPMLQVCEFIHSDK